LKRTRDILKFDRFDQVPELSSSREIRFDDPFSLESPTPSGRRRALLVGISYRGSPNPRITELDGPATDIANIKPWLHKQGFTETDMKILMDDNVHERPTKEMIVSGMRWLVDGCNSNDSLFFYYSGHGCQVADQNGDEADGKDECLVSWDGQVILDDLVNDILVKQLPRNAHLTFFCDACHSASMMDLPYMFRADNNCMQALDNGNVTQLPAKQDFKWDKWDGVDLIDIFAGSLATSACGTDGVVSSGYGSSGFGTSGFGTCTVTTTVTTSNGSGTSVFTSSSSGSSPLGAQSSLLHSITGKNDYHFGDLTCAAAAHLAGAIGYMDKEGHLGNVARSTQADILEAMQPENSSSAMDKIANVGKAIGGGLSNFLGL